MKNKGFTLIELLAVIVILAIIALIATPTILGVVETARKGAAESSVLGYVDAVEKQAMINEMDDKTDNDISEGNFTIAQLKTAKVSVKGQAPTAVVSGTTGTPAEDGTLAISAGEVGDARFTLGKYTVQYTKSTGKAVAE